MELNSQPVALDRVRIELLGGGGVGNYPQQKIGSRTQNDIYLFHFSYCYAYVAVLHCTLNLHFQDD